jgi:hypothetical protein
MDTFTIFRRSGWASMAELEAAAARSTKVGNEQMADQVKWIRSYILREPDGRVGTVCIYQATDRAAIERHAKLAELPCDEIVGVSDAVVVRPDP